MRLAMCEKPEQVKELDELLTEVEKKTWNRSRKL